MTQIVSIQSNRPQNIFYVHWNLGKRCNFDCSYCADSLHDFISPHRSLENLITIADNMKKNILHDKIRIWFTGGEPTVNPNFLKFCKYLYADGRFLLGLNTNGSRTTRYYLNLLECVDTIQFSSHFEFLKDDKFKETLTTLVKETYGSGKAVNINLMMEPEYWDRAVSLIKHCKQFSIEYHIKRIRNKDNFTSINRQYSPIYTDDQLRFITDAEYRHTYLEDYNE